jgi:hypothetical protein
MVRRHDVKNKITLARKRRVCGEVAGMLQPGTSTCVSCGWLVLVLIVVLVIFFVLMVSNLFLMLCLPVLVGWLVGGTCTHVHCFPGVLGRFVYVSLLCFWHCCRAVWKSCACKIKRSTKNTFVRFGC